MSTAWKAGQLPSIWQQQEDKLRQKARRQPASLPNPYHVAQSTVVCCPTLRHLLPLRWPRNLGVPLKKVSAAAVSSTAAQVRQSSDATSELAKTDPA